jgi:urease accessory protein
MRAAHAETHLCGVVADRPGLWPGRTVASGWQAELALDFTRRRERTVLAARRQRGPLTVQRPFYPEPDGVCHTYVLHPPAGIVGGDDLRMRFDLAAGSHGLITTPAATRWYWSPGIEARIDQQATVAAGATLEWLPQETLLFAGAHARLATRIELVGDARFVGWEILGLGRPACGEVFRDGRVDFRFEISRDGRPVLFERLRGDADGMPGMQGHTACAMFVATGADATALDASRGALGGSDDALAAATLIGDVLVVRALAAHCEPLLGTCNRVWGAIRPLVLGRVAVAPRIWHT